MYIKDRKACKKITAGDNTALRELLNPLREPGLAIGFSLAEARVKPGHETLPHKLKTAEVYYLLEGRAEMRINEERRSVGPGQAVYIPPRSIQSIKNIGRTELVFLCLVDPAWKAEDEELVDAQ
jgi:mannose-6-phosphate isomerase-like protein (cupin superfamily)